MRKLFAIALFTAMIVPGMAPLLAMEQAETIPACCRRQGKHHCMAMHKHSSDTSPAFNSQPEKCPMKCCVKAHGQLAMTSLNARVLSFVAARETVVSFSQKVFVAAGFSSHTDRGPPVIHLV